MGKLAWAFVSNLHRAQRVHRECRIRIHANEPVTPWADPPRLI